MAEIKYKYALDENGRRVSIDTLSKEEIKFHTYRCVGCGNQILPRAIGSKYRRAHFYHKDEVICSAETYLHKLAKQVIKDKFDSSPEFYIEYYVTEKCNNTTCKYRNIHCENEHSSHKVDLKKDYDTCTEESTIKGYVADLLLTNSKNPDIKPILIEVCVSHPCDEEKKNSGLQIIEIKIRGEEDIISIDVIQETPMVSKKERNVFFYSFNRELQVPFHVKHQRYIYNPEQNPNGYITKIDCSLLHYRLRKDSLLELNVVNTKYFRNCDIIDILLWMSKHKGLRRCNLCKFYYAMPYEDYPICRLSKKYGKPSHPKMDEAERCSSYRIIDGCLFFSNPDDFFIEEVTSFPTQMKPEYKVILAASTSFNNSRLYKEKILFYLSRKISTHTIVIITGVSKNTDYYTGKLLEDKDIDFIEEPHEADWGKYGAETVNISNYEMTKSADALIAFWDGSSSGIKNLIDQAKRAGIKVGVVKFTPELSQSEDA